MCWHRANAFDCGVNDLPLSLFVSWFERSRRGPADPAVAGYRNIRLGLTLPGVPDPGARLYHPADKFALKPIGDPARTW